MENTKLKNLGLVLDAINEEEIFKSIRLILEQTSSKLIKEELKILKTIFHQLRKKRLISKKDKRTIRRIQKVLLSLLVEIELGDSKIHLTKKDLVKTTPEIIREIHGFIENNLNNLINRLEWVLSMRKTSRIEYFLDNTVENFFFTRNRLEKWVKQLKKTLDDKSENEWNQEFLKKIKSYYLISLEMKLQLSIITGYLEKKESYYKYRNLNGRVNYLYQNFRLCLESLIYKKKTFKKFRRFLKTVNSIEEESLKKLNKIAPKYQERLKEVFEEINEIILQK